MVYRRTCLAAPQLVTSVSAFHCPLLARSPVHSLSPPPPLSLKVAVVLTVQRAYYFPLDNRVPVDINADPHILFKCLRNAPKQSPNACHNNLCMACLLCAAHFTDFKNSSEFVFLMTSLVAARSTAPHHQTRHADSSRATVAGESRTFPKAFPPTYWRGAKWFKCGAEEFAWALSRSMTATCIGMSGRTLMR